MNSYHLIKRAAAEQPAEIDYAKRRERVKLVRTTLLGAASGGYVGGITGGSKAMADGEPIGAGALGGAGLGALIGGGLGLAGGAVSNGLNRFMGVDSMVPTVATERGRYDRQKSAAEFPAGSKPSASELRSLLPGSLADGAVTGGVGGAALGGLAGAGQALFDGEDDGISSTLGKILGGAGIGAGTGAVVGGGAAAYKRHNAGKKVKGIADYFRAAMEEKRKEIQGAKPQVSLEELIQQAKQKAGDVTGFRGGDPTGQHPGMLR